MKNEPKIGSYVDDEEKALIEAIENTPSGEYTSVLTDEKKLELQAIAQNSIENSRKKISLRIPASNLVKLKAKAEAEGLPYQTLLNSIIHKAVNE